MIPGGLPPIDAALLPDDVRTPAQRQAYGAALGFERMLVEQLASSLQQTTGEEGGDYAQLLPGALADSVEQSGGLGLARTIYEEIR